MHRNQVQSYYKLLLAASTHEQRNIIVPLLKSSVYEQELVALSEGTPFGRDLKPMGAP